MEIADADVVLPLPRTGASPSSRPSTRATNADGSGASTQPARSPLLRQPRSPSVTPGSPVISEMTQVNKRRLSVFMRRQSIVPYMGRSVKPKEATALEPNAAQLAYSALHDTSNPYRISKDQVLKQFYLWNGRDIKRIYLPPLPVAKKQETNICRAWNADDQAVRQLGNTTRNGPRHFINLTRCVTNADDFHPAAEDSGRELQSGLSSTTAGATAIEKISHRELPTRQMTVVKDCLCEEAQRSSYNSATEAADTGIPLGSARAHPALVVRVRHVEALLDDTGGSKKTGGRRRPSAASSRGSRCASAHAARASLQSRAQRLEKLRQVEQSLFLQRIDMFIANMRKTAALHTIPKRSP